MVNNLTSINKTKNFLWPHIIEHKKTVIHVYAQKIQIMVWERHKNVAELNRLVGSNSPPPEHAYKLSNENVIKSM